MSIKLNGVANSYRIFFIVPPLSTFAILSRTLGLLVGGGNILVFRGMPHEETNAVLLASLLETFQSF
jgi:hypothetical protein